MYISLRLTVKSCKQCKQQFILRWNKNTNKTIMKNMKEKKNYWILYQAFGGVVQQKNKNWRRKNWRNWIQLDAHKIIFTRNQCKRTVKHLTLFIWDYFWNLKFFLYTFNTLSYDFDASINSYIAIFV